MDRISYRAFGWASLAIATGIVATLAPGCTTNNYYYYGQGGGDDGATSTTAEVTTTASTTASTTSSDSSTSSSSASSTSSSTGSGQPCTDGDQHCDDVATLLTCVDGAFESQTCGDVCGDNGYASNGCSSDSCQCGNQTDIDCKNGVEGFCYCAEQAGSPCADPVQYYVDCHHNTGDISPVAHCFATFVIGNSIDCNAAINACL